MPNTLRRDLSYIMLLTVLAALPLVVLRYVAVAQILPLLVWAIWLIAFGFWVQPLKGIHRRHSKPAPQLLGKSLFVSSLLLGCTIGAFYVPMLRQFWLGGDEIVSLIDSTRLWEAVTVYDAFTGRPLVALGSILVGSLVPNHVEGFLWLALYSRFLCSALIYAIVRSLVPKMAYIALSAGLLFAISPIEQSRLLALFMQGYNVLVFLLLLALFLFVAGFKKKNTLLLGISCVLLSMGCLMSEVSFPFALLFPVLILLNNDRRRLGSWLLAWAAVIVLMVVRYVQFVAVRGAGYQMQTLNLTSDTFFETALIGFLRMLGAPGNYLKVYPASSAEWLYGLALGVFVAAGLIIYWRIFEGTKNEKQVWQRYAIGVLFAYGGFVLNIVLFVPFGSDFRAHFLSSTALAVVWAFMLGARLSLPLQKWWLALVTGFLVTLSAASSFNIQENYYPFPELTYEKVKQFVGNLTGIAPNIADETLLVFMTENINIGADYYIDNLAQYLYGSTVRAVFLPEAGMAVLAEGVQIYENAIFDRQNRLYGFDEIIVFRFESLTDLTLLSTFPAAFAPPEPNQTQRYMPQARIRDDLPIRPNGFIN